MAAGWEYQYITTPPHGLKDLVAKLNELDADGWEVIGFAPQQGKGVFSGYAVLIKRARAQE
jgi:hypothetical protein